MIPRSYLAARAPESRLAFGSGLYTLRCRLHACRFMVPSCMWSGSDRLRSGGRPMVKKIVVALAMGFGLAGGANAQETVKIGVIVPYSGPFADAGNQLD